MSRHGRRRWALNERFVVGTQENPMLERWRLVQTPWFGIYVHFIYREDLDPYPHDHPWNFFRLVLRGGYSEHYSGSVVGTSGVLRRWSWGYVRTDAQHRITSVLPGTVSLAIVGRKVQDWGFFRPLRPEDEQHVRDGYAVAVIKVDYRDYLGLRPRPTSVPSTQEKA